VNVNYTEYGRDGEEAREDVEDGVENGVGNCFYWCSTVSGMASKGTLSLRYGSRAGVVHRKRRNKEVGTRFPG
jgi:hypothetical protein